MSTCPEGVSPARRSKFGLIPLVRHDYLIGLGSHALEDAGYEKLPPLSLSLPIDFYNGKSSDGVGIQIIYNARMSDALRVQQPDIPGPAGQTLTNFSALVEQPEKLQAEEILRGSVGHLFSVVAHPGYPGYDSNA